MMKPTFDIFRQIGKAWATAVKPTRRKGYVKQGTVLAPTGQVFTRGGKRAARRRAERARIKAAS